MHNGGRFAGFTCPAWQAMDSYSGKPRAVITDGMVEDIDEAGRATRYGSDGAMGQMAGFHRGRLVRRFADLTIASASNLGRQPTPVTTSRVATVRPRVSWGERRPQAA